MLAFATEFPVEHSKTITEFRDAVREWLLGSRYTCLTIQNLEELGKEDEWSFSVGSETIESLQARTKDNNSVAFRYTKTADDLEWITSIVFSERPTSRWVSIRIVCESMHPAARLPAAKKPILVKTLLAKLGGGYDGKLAVTDLPTILKNSDIEFSTSCILGTTNSYLPIVYVSAPFQGGYLVDINKLAKELSGMAHVVVEPNRAFSIRLMNEVKSQNVYGGTVGIYWPEGSGRRSFFIDQEIESNNNLEHAIFEEIQSALKNRRPLARCTWAAVKETQSRCIINQLKAQGSTEIDKYISAFDEELKAKATERQEAETEIQRLKAEIRMYEAQSQMSSGLLIRTGQERDFFPGELLDIAREAFSEMVTKVPKDSRRQHVLTSFIDTNASVGEAASIREQLKVALRNYQSMDLKTRKILEGIGFRISDSGKHVKLIFRGDDRYSFTLAKSSSDYRGGMNAASDIARLLF